MRLLPAFLATFAASARRDRIAQLACLALVLLAADSASAFSYFTDPTKWSPLGPGRYQTFTSKAPDGPHTSGVASYSFMAGGVGLDVRKGDLADHQDLLQAPPIPGVSYPLSSLLAPRQDESEFEREGRVRHILADALEMWRIAVDPVDQSDLWLFEVQDSNMPGGDPGGGNHGDIRIGAYWFKAPVTVSHPEMDQLAHAYKPGTSALSSSILGDIHFRCRLNNDKTSSLYCPGGVLWTDEARTPDGQFDLMTVALHEIGHALGLGHSDAKNSIMGATYTGQQRLLGVDDVGGIQAIYTPLPEPSLGLLAATGALAVSLMRRRQRRGDTGDQQLLAALDDNKG